MQSLPYACTRPCGRKVFLLLRALASPSTSATVCARALDHCSATHCWWQHCASTKVKALRQPADHLSAGRAPMYTGTGSTHTRRATERRLHFDSPARTRVNSDSCVNNGYCLRLFSVDTSPSTYLPPFPSRTLPRSTRTMTDTGGQLRSSICSGTMPNFCFREARQL